MPKTTDLKAILENVLAGKATAKDLQIVQQALASGKIIFAAGSRSVASESIKKSIIVIGNQNQLRVEASQADYDRLREQFFTPPPGSVRSFRLRDGMRRAQAFLPWLFTAAALSLVTEVARRFLNGNRDWPDTAAVIAWYLFATLAATAGVLAVTAFLSPARPVLGKAFASGIVNRFNTKKTLLVTGIVLVVALALTLSLPLFARWYNERGTRFQNREQPDLVAARECYKQALRLNPSLGQAHYNLASTYEASEPEKAIEEYTLATQYDSKIGSANIRLARLYNNKGYQYHRQGNASYAFELYRQAVNCDPTYAKAHYDLAVAYEDLHEFSEAKSEYLSAIKLDNRLVRAYNNLARLYLATGKDKQDYEYALNLLRDALNLSPQDDNDLYSIYKNFGWACYALGRPQPAEAYLNEAIRLRQDKAAAHCLLAYMLKRLGRAKAATENCFNCVSQYEGETDKDVEPIWFTDAQQSFNEGGCNEAK